MNHVSEPIHNKAIYRERLQQALRVMQGVVERHEEDRFDINTFARDSEGGVICCIAGFCGLDPWFQERGLVTKVGNHFGDVSILPEEFFGTDKPFYAPKYGKPSNLVTIDDGIAALNRAIDEMSDTPEASGQA
jgi:hypothetical protein